MVWAVAGDGARDPMVITTADRVANGLVFMVVVGVSSDGFDLISGGGFQGGVRADSRYQLRHGPFGISHLSANRHSTVSPLRKCR